MGEGGRRRRTWKTSGAMYRIEPVLPVIRYDPEPHTQHTHSLRLKWMLVDRGAWEHVRFNGMERSRQHVGLGLCT